MKNLLLIVTLFFIYGVANSQGLQSAIENKVWTLEQSYVNDIRNYDTLFVKFESSGSLLSGKTVEEVSGSDTSSVNSLQATGGEVYSILEENGVESYPLLTISDGEEQYTYQVIYYDADDLVLVDSGILQDTGLEYYFEYRYILYK